jgi:small subunit ribosomal protein S16
VAVKIRLKRLGKLKSPHYRIVVADSRTKRDGRAIEEIGRYVPTNDPSIIEINSERALYWLSVGAQPTEQVAALLKLTGDFQKSKGDATAKNTVKPQIAKEAFVADTKKKPVLKPREEIALKKSAGKVSEEVVEAVAVAAVAEGIVEDVVEAAGEVVAVEAVAEVVVEEATAEAVAEAVVEEAAVEVVAEVVVEDAAVEVVVEDAAAEVVEEVVAEAAPAEEAPAAEHATPEEA